MRSVITLMSWQARHARAALILAALVGALVSIGLHLTFPPPVAQAQAAAYAVAVSTALWAVYFASDALASERASGGLATLALLPVGPWTLFAARTGFVCAATVLQLAWLLACQALLQAGSGSALTWFHFEDCLIDLAGWAPLGLCLASSALFASNLVENALAALLIALIGGAALLGAGVGLLQIATGVGWFSANAELPSALGAGLALILWALTGWAFARGQRRLDARRVRIGWALGPLFVLVLGAVGAAAFAHHRRFDVELENPWLRFVSLTSSADGRFLALSVEQDRPGNDDPPGAVWLLDVEHGRRELVAQPGLLLGDRLADLGPIWDQGHALRVLQLEREVLPPSFREHVAEVSLEGEGWTVRRLDDVSAVVEGMRRPPRFPAWAEIESTRTSKQLSCVTVRWIGRGLEASFRGPIGRFRPGGTVLPTMREGLVVVHDGERIFHFDLETCQETNLVTEDVGFGLQLSSDGSAVLVRGRRATRVLDAASGQALHEPWDAREWSASWVRGRDGARVVALRPVGVPVGPVHVLDLDARESFNLETANDDRAMCQLGSRGFALVRPDGDLVWVDRAGALVRVLVDR